MKKILIFLMFIGLTLGLVGCAVKELGEITFNAESIKVEEGEEIVLNANLTNFPDGVEVEWSTVDVNIIVSKKDDGSWTVLGVNKGEAVVVIKAKDVGGRIRSASLKIEVIEKELEDLTLEITGEEEVEVGNVTQLNVNTNRTPIEEVVWTSSNDAVATVANGLVSAVSKGEATITASCEGKNATLKVNVIEPLSSLVIDVTGEKKGYVGKTIKLEATLSRESDESVAWSVSDQSLATIDQTGLVTLLKSGKVTVIAKCEDAIKSYVIDAVTFVEKVEITGESSVLVRKFITLTAVVTPADVSEKVVWASDNVAVAKVSQTGLVVGQSAGTAKITAKVGDVVAEHVVEVIASTDMLTPEDLTAIGDFTITFRVPFGDAIKTTIREIIASFQAEWFETYGTNVTVTLDEVGGYNELNTSIIYDLQSGTAPTMTVGYPDHFAGYLIGNALEPLNKYINDPVYGFLNNEMDDIYADYLVECKQFDVAGTYYALPFNKSTELFIYNYTFFLEFLDDFKTVFPEIKCVEDLFKDLTWQKIEQISRKTVEIVKSGRADTCLQIDGKNTETFVPFAYDSLANLFITTIRQWGGVYTKQKFLSSGKVNLQSGEICFNSDETRSALSYLNSLSYNKVDSVRTPLFAVPEYWEKSYASDPFKAGECVMTVGSSAGVSYNTGGVGQIGMTAIPYNSEKNIKQVIQQGTNVTIFAAAKDYEKLAAWLLIKHFLKTENAALFATSTGYFPVSKSARETELYQNYILKGYSPYLKDKDGNYIKTTDGKYEINKNYSAAAAAATVDYNALGFTFFVDPAWSGSATVRTKVETIVTQVVTANTDIQKAIDDVLSTIN